MRDEKDRIIWDNVEKILKEKDWSLVDLAKHMEVTPQAINSLKKGGIGTRSIKKLSTALNVDEIRLLSIELPPSNLTPSLLSRGSMPESLLTVMTDGRPGCLAWKTRFTPIQRWGQTFLDCVSRVTACCPVLCLGILPS